MKLMGKEGEDYDCEDDDDDDDDDHHEKEDKVFETDRLADNEKEHGHHKRHRMRCHHRRWHKILKISLLIVGLLVLITIVAIVAWYVLYCSIRSFMNEEYLFDEKKRRNDVIIICVYFFVAAFADEDSA